MDQIVLFALLGLGTGALIAGIGLGVVLTYRGSGVINVATGAMAMAAGYAFYSLKTVVDTPLALVGTLAFTIVLGAAVELLCFRPLRTSSPLARLVSSLGVLLTLQAGATLIYGTGSLPAPSVLPRDTVEVTGVAIPADRFWLTGIVIVITILLAVAYRYTRFGLATRAGSENEVSAILAGLPAGELSLANTVLSAVIAGGMGVLAASLAQLDATTLPLQVVPALGAVLFARFTSFGITTLVGLSIGVVQSLLYYASTQSWFPTDKGAALPGISSLLTFIIIVIALYVRGSSLPTRGELIEQRLPAVPRPERLGSSAALAAVVGVGGPDRAALRLPQRADHLAGGDDHLPVLRGHHGVHRPGVADADRAGRLRRASWSRTSSRTSTSASRSPRSPASWRRPSWASWPAPRRCACAASAWRW